MASYAAARQLGVRTRRGGPGRRGRRPTTAPSRPSATICWASTSSGLAGTRIDSISPARIRSTATAVWARSPRCLGNSTPRLTSPTWWPARPTRCSALATLGGDSIWMTRSTAPMSMPSSRLLVATTQGRRPRLRSSSIRARCSLETEPWWALAITGAAPSAAPDWAITCAGGAAVVDRPPRPAPLGGDLVEPRGEPLGQAAGVGEDDRRAVLLDEVDDVLLHVRPDRGRLAAVALGLVASRRTARGRSCPRPARRPSGPTPCRRRRDDLDRRGAAEEARDLLERAHGRGQPDPLRRLRRAARRAARG